MSENNYALTIRHLSVGITELSQSGQSFFQQVVNPKQQTSQLLKNVTLSVKQGEKLGIVGESGSGKSLTIKSILGLYNFRPGIIKGKITYRRDSEEIDLLDSTDLSENSAFFHRYSRHHYITSWHLPVDAGQIELPDEFVDSEPFELLAFNSPEHWAVLPEDKFTMNEARDHLFIHGEKYSKYTHAYLCGEAKLTPNAFKHIDLINKRLRKEREQGTPIQGEEISLILQDPMTFLNPYWSIERQLKNLRSIHGGNSEFDDEIRSHLINLKINNESFLKAQPRELSGGQIQRAMIVIAQQTNPKLLVADEPTTGLDVTLKREVVEHFKHDFENTMIFISHDLNMVREVSERINVMYAGEMIENCQSENFLSAEDHHPYTEKLVNIYNTNYQSSIEKDPLDSRDMKNFPGCKFALRECEYREQMGGICEKISPPAIEIESGKIAPDESPDVNWAKCWKFLEE